MQDIFERYILTLETCSRDDSKLIWS